MGWWVMSSTGGLPGELQEIPSKDAQLLHRVADLELRVERLERLMDRRTAAGSETGGSTKYAERFEGVMIEDDGADPFEDVGGYDVVGPGGNGGGPGVGAGADPAGVCGAVDLAPAEERVTR